MGAPSIASLFAQRVVVGVGDMSVSNNAAITLSTYALGSCVAVVLYDAGSQAGGLLHLMLPDSKLSPAKASTQPAMFADTGLPLLFRAFQGVRGDLSRMRIAVVGGASVLAMNDTFKIGERNLRTVTELLARAGYRAQHSAVGGTINRTVHLELATGNVTMKTPAGNDSCSLAY
jgi:chemotaxis protein CheD